MNVKVPPSISHRDAMIEAFREVPARAREYAEAYLEDGTPAEVRACLILILDALLPVTDEKARPNVPNSEHESDSLPIATASEHITPPGGNIFLDLGFPPEEAEVLKADSDRRMRAKRDVT